MRSHSMGLGAKGVESAEDAKQLLYALAADLTTGSVDPERAHATARVADVANKTHLAQLKEREIALRERDQARRWKLLEAEAIQKGPKQIT